jgi:sec-independent protein translocase protein TatB
MVEMGLTPTIQMASFGIQDSLFLMLLALVVFGPRRLPEIGRQIGKLMYEFRKVSNDFKFQMEEELRASEEAERQRKLQASLPPPAPAPSPESAHVTLDVPPHPVSAAEPADELTAPAAADESSAAAVSGEVRAEERHLSPAPPQIHPPAGGEPIAAARPFRERPAGATTSAETVTESGSEPEHNAATAFIVADEGRVGTEVQPGVVTDTEREAHHA